MLERSNYIAAVAKKYDIDKKALTETVNRMGLEAEDIRLAKETQERIVQQKKNGINSRNGQLMTEKLLVSMLSNNRNLFEKAAEYIGEADLTDDMCRQLYKIVSELYAEGKNIELAKIVNRFDSVEEQEIVAEILDPSLYGEKYGESEKDAAFADIVIRIMNNSIEAQMAQAEADNDPEALQACMARKNETESVRRKLLNS